MLPMSDKQTQATTDFGYREVPEADKRTLVQGVFDSVAGRYDLMNDLMSLGVHRLWKREFLSALDPTPRMTLLDLASGTGDIGFGWIARGGGPALLTDVNASMLAVAARRSMLPAAARRTGLRTDAAPMMFAQVDAEAIPLADRSVERVSIAFGLRNCTHKERVLAEARRVLKPGGRFLCLEFSRVTVAAVAPVYERWSFAALPLLGRLVAGDEASYRYLAESIRTFPDQETLAGMMRVAGFVRVSVRNLSGGIAAIHAGWRL